MELSAYQQSGDTRLQLCNLHKLQTREMLNKLFDAGCARPCVGRRFSIKGTKRDPIVFLCWPFSDPQPV